MPVVNSNGFGAGRWRKNLRTAAYSGMVCWWITNQVAVDLFGFQDVPWEGKSDRDLMTLCPRYAQVLELCIKSDESAWKSGKTSYTEGLMSLNKPF